MYIMHSHTEIGLWPRDDYPHTCEHLGWWEKHAIEHINSGYLIHMYLREIIAWCKEHNIEYVWSQGEHTKRVNVGLTGVVYPNSIGFTRKEDLLAFKLKFEA